MKRLSRRRFVTAGAALAASVAADPVMVRLTTEAGSPEGLVPPQWNQRNHWIDTGWGFPYVGNQVEGAMFDAAWELAQHRGWEHDRTPNDDYHGQWLSCPGDDDMVRALKESLPIAAVYHDLCVGMGIPVPELVQQAFDQLRPQLFGQAAPIEWRSELPPLTPESIENDPTLTGEQKAYVYNLLFEYTGDGDDEWNTA